MTSLDGMLVHETVTPANLLLVPILYTLVKKDKVEQRVLP